jgi:ATP-dependent Clp protease protease subunit
VMIYQGSAGFSGATPDLDIHMKHVLKLINRLTDLLAFHTGQPAERVKRDSDRDYFMDAQAAVDYGIVDEILPTTKPTLMTALGTTTAATAVA